MCEAELSSSVSRPPTFLEHRLRFFGLEKIGQATAGSWSKLTGAPPCSSPRLPPDPILGGIPIGLGNLGRDPGIGDRSLSLGQRTVDPYPSVNGRLVD
jgi:hypothetical protein